MNAGITTARTRPAPRRSRNEIENIRLIPSSVTAGRNPMKSTVAQGNEVFSMSLYGTSAGAHAPKRAATT